LLLHHHAWGPEDGPPVLALHGVRGHARRFRRLAEERLARSHRVIAVDLRGHGHSGWDPPWDLGTHVADVLETLDTLGIDRVVPMGHSYGGRVVAELAAAAPDRVMRPILLDPALHVPAKHAVLSAEDEFAAVTFLTVEEAIASRYASGALARTPRVVLEEEMAEHLVEDEAGRLRLRYCPSAVVVAWSEMARPQPPPETLPGPALFVVAESDPLISPEQVAPYRAALGDRLEVVTTPGGHVVYWEAFEETADAVERFLARTED
jgi:lipase